MEMSDVFDDSHESELTRWPLGDLNEILHM